MVMGEPEAPNLSTKLNVILFLLESMGLFRKPLKTTLIAMLDVPADRYAFRLAGFGSRVFNRLFGADFRMQALPEPFDLWADGVDIVVFDPDILVGFSDAGAHLRNMAHYSFPLRMLKRVRDAERAGKPFMSTERAVFRLTSEIASAQRRRGSVRADRRKGRVPARAAGRRVGRREIRPGLTRGVNGGRWSADRAIVGPRDPRGGTHASAAPPAAASPFGLQPRSVVPASAGAQRAPCRPRGP
jgi:hypothetical protein